MNPKTKWRQQLIEKRKTISKERREEASAILKEKLYNKGKTLSFTSFGSEIDLGPLNNLLAKEGRLFLIPYLLETAEALLPISFPDVDCILVPGLGFDKEFYRIGYGKGFYDRLLAEMGNVLTIGVGFKEQFSETPLPRDPWDLPVKELLLA